MPDSTPRTGQRIALFAGSFDPITNGHVDVVGKAVHLADRLVIAVGIHPGKTPMFSADERLAMITEACAPLAPARSTAWSLPGCHGADNRRHLGRRTPRQAIDELTRLR